jgi:hypothetical protein
MNNSLYQAELRKVAIRLLPTLEEMARNSPYCSKTKSIILDLKDISTAFKSRFCGETIATFTGVRITSALRHLDIDPVPYIMREAPNSYRYTIEFYKNWGGGVPLSWMGDENPGRTSITIK